MNTREARIELFGIRFHAADFDSAVESVLAAAQRGEKGMVVTPNVDNVVTFHQRPEVLEIYRNARFVFADGAPVVWVSRMIKDKALPCRVTGADLMPALCARAAELGLSVGMVGGNPGVADRAAEILRDRHPGLDVVAVHCPPFGFEHDSAQSQAIVDLCNETRPRLLFLGVGAPKQELWGYAHLDKLDVGMVLCVGAAFDFVAGTLTRAPAWMRNAGLEWVWRLLHEPKRLFKRYLQKDLAFFPIALREIAPGFFKSNTNPTR